MMNDRETYELFWGKTSFGTGSLEECSTYRDFLVNKHYLDSYGEEAKPDDIYFVNVRTGEVRG